MDNDYRITVIPEGREGVWLADRVSLSTWIKAQKFESIHHFIVGPLIVGCDYDVESVLDDIVAAKRVGVLTGESQDGNMGHALALILEDSRGEALNMYDIGPVTDADLAYG